MRRLLLAIFQISIVIWSAYIVFKHDLHDPSQVMPFLAAVIVKGWVSDNVNDPLFGRQSAQGWFWSKIKKLAPKGQPKETWDV